MRVAVEVLDPAGGRSAAAPCQSAAGTSELRFDLRAIHPGDYRALPAYVEAMYVPEVRANSDARRIRITE